VPVRHLVQLARRLEVTQLGIGQHDTHAPLQHHASCALLEPKRTTYKSTAYGDVPMARPSRRTHFTRHQYHARRTTRGTTRIRCTAPTYMSTIPSPTWDEA